VSHVPGTLCCHRSADSECGPAWGRRRAAGSRRWLIPGSNGRASGRRLERFAQGIFGSPVRCVGELRGGVTGSGGLAPDIRCPQHPEGVCSPNNRQPATGCPRSRVAAIGRRPRLDSTYTSTPATPAPGGGPNRRTVDVYVLSTVHKIRSTTRPSPTPATPRPNPHPAVPTPPSTPTAPGPVTPAARPGRPVQPSQPRRTGPTEANRGDWGCWLVSLGG
jgi:hypothetical protein